MLTIDGSFGEGGGQILRSSLALSAVTGTPFRIERIRANRSKPGLKRQHLTAVLAAAEVCSAQVDGAMLGSTRVEFSPGEVRAGNYRFAIGTSGSTSLVLQTVLPPLLRAPAPSTVILEGGTHNPFAPPFDFLERVFVPLVERLGPRVRLELERPGFVAAGGGRLRAVVSPAATLRGFELLERGKTRRRHARALVANLPRHIAERELDVLRKRLGWPPECFEIVEVADSAGPGNVVMVEIASEHVTEIVTAFGEVRRPAETVARDAVRQACRYLDATAPVGEHLTDQLLLPLALAGSGGFRAIGLSRHATTHIELIRKFLAIEIRVEPLDDGEVIVRVG